MKYDIHKAFPYPILADDKNYNDDYPVHGFNASITFEPDETGERAILTSRFTIAEESILKCIESKKATYGVHVLCPKTNYRHLIRSEKKELEHHFERGELYENVTLMGCIVCTDNVPDYRSNNLHEDLKESKYDMPQGGVLAITEPETYFVDPDLSRPLMSVFRLSKDSKIKKEFQYDVEGEIILIKMNESELARFNAARRDQNTRKFVIMGVYYPVVVEVLRVMASEDKGIHENKKWYRAIMHRLELFEINLTDPRDDKIYLYAQRLMEYPLTTLPLVD